jgi:hypothetical protein
MSVMIYTIYDLCNKDDFMKFYSKLFCSLVVLNLVPILTPSSFAANEIKKPTQSRVEKKGKYKSGRSPNSKAGNVYSVSQPYNPNNPPPIGNKLHPVSSNAH